MKVEEKKWRQHVKEFGSNGVLVTNCIAAAAFLTYCGGMNTDARQVTRLIPHVFNVHALATGVVRFCIYTVENEISSLTFDIFLFSC